MTRPPAHRLLAVILAAVLPFAPWMGPGTAEARVNPLTFITRQMHKPNMLIVLDTSGSMNGVPGGAFTYSSEVGVDCDDGQNCRGWTGSTGICSASGRSCASNTDCQQPYCKVGKGTCTSDLDCPTQGTCQIGKYVCKGDADCAVYGEGKCTASGAACSLTKPCAARGKCSDTSDGCTNPGKSCKTGRCKNAKGPLCASDKDCGAKGTGTCFYGSTPAGGCTLDSQCPTAKTCSTGESCTSDSNCPKFTVGSCKVSKKSCTKDADCTTSGGFTNDSYVDSCVFPKNSCSGTANYCVVDYEKCIYPAGNTCDEVPNACWPSTNKCNIPVINACLTPAAGDTCQLGAAVPGALKMCQQAQSLCNTNADCPAGDTCGNPTSRTVIAKRTLSRIISDNYDILNFGLMTFYQGNYFPYYEVTSPTPSTETVFLVEMAIDGTCYSPTTGPTTTCMYKGQEFKLAPGNNSRYAVNTAGGTKTYDVPWCGDLCEIAGAGTGTYEGSYFFAPSTAGTVTSTKKTLSSYVGKSTVISGKAHRYYDALPNYYNGGAAPPMSFANCTPGVCNASCGARWDSQLSSFIDPKATPAQNKSNALKMIDWMSKASHGGLLTFGGTPTGCTLENDGAKQPESSAYHYMEKVVNGDAIACRPNYVLLITDGEANGPGDVGCDAAACSEDNPETAGCTCRSVLAAYHMRKNLGVKTFVVGFSSDVAVGKARAVNDNIAKAGGSDFGGDGTSPFAFLATNEAELQTVLQRAILDAVRGSYSTSPATASSGTQLSSSIKSGKYALDARVDFPSWEGHLLAYDVTVEPPVIRWDANTELKEMNWWERRVYVGSKDGSAIRVKVDPDTKTVSNAGVLHSLGIGASPEEAERIMRFALGDPSMGNPAVLGAMVNSTPIDVGQPGDNPFPGGRQFFQANKDRPNLVYVGASDGMLHAFFTNETQVGGVTYSAGSEAFAYIPPGMFGVLTKLYVQKGQVPNPAQHVFGLANSPKVKNLCVQNCADAETAVWKTLLVMNEGYGGSDMFVLDITNPVGPSGFADPPVVPVWDSSSAHLQSSYEASVGQTISVPAFFFNKTDALNDYRLIFASGYPMPGAPANQGKRIVIASASNGQILDHETPVVGGSCSQDYTLLADVASAKDFGAEQKQKLRAAYVGDTWGNLHVYDGTSLTTLAKLGCNHPLHFAPTVVQLDRDDPTNNAGQLYLVQVTNSTLDDDTFSLPPSQLVIMKQAANGAGKMELDPTFGAGGKMTLTVGSSELCAVTDDAGGCKTKLPLNARPTGTPTAILKRDGSGFQMITMWYAQDAYACSKGSTWLTLHEVIGSSVTQKQGFKVADEPVTSPVVVGGKIYVVGSQGALNIGGDLSAAIMTGTSSPTAGISGIYQTLGWVEL